MIADGLAADELGLFTDLNELNMAQAYRAERLDARAVFSLHFRRLPPGRNFVLGGGQPHAARRAAGLGFAPLAIEPRAASNAFRPDLLAWLAGSRFSGEIGAGTRLGVAEALLQTVVRHGRPIGPEPDPEAARGRVAEARRPMPEPLRRFEDTRPPYPVRISEVPDTLCRRAAAAA